MRLLIILLFLVNILHAQYAQRADYSLNDPCPDPKKNKIASRTIYTNRSGDPADTKYIDTAYEKYDRKGNLMSLTYSRFSASQKDVPAVKHEFQYDEKGRIVLDQSQNTAGGWRTSYRYNDTAHTLAVHTTSGFSHSEPDFINIYYSENGDTTEYGMNEQGDTIHFMHATKSKRIVITWEPDFSHKRVMIDSVTTVRTKRMITETAWFIDRHGNPSVSENIFHLDKHGRVIDELIYLDGHTLRDSTHNTYDKKGRIALSVNTIFPLGNYAGDTAITTWTMKYLYDKKGRLAQTQNTTSKQDYLLYMTNYIYNERGLLTEIHHVELDHGKIIREEREHWVYTYY